MKTPQERLNKDWKFINDNLKEWLLDLDSKRKTLQVYEWKNTLDYLTYMIREKILNKEREETLDYVKKQIDDLINLANNTTFFYEKETVVKRLEELKKKLEVEK